MLIGEEGLARFVSAGFAMIPVSENPIDAIWNDRPPPPLGPAHPHPLAYAGQDSDAKRALIAATLAAAGQDAAVISDPASIAWLFNIRGADVPFTPFALGFALVHSDARADLFMAPAKLPGETLAWLGNAVTALARDALPGALAALTGKKVRVDAAGSPVWFAQTLRATGASVVEGADPCLLPKACKNDTEQRGARAAQRRDGAALCRFLHDFPGHAANGAATEISLADALLVHRARSVEFRGESFPAISAAGEHAAIMHYRASPAHDRPIHPNELYLIDSGSQYPDGTTDITRTLWSGPDAPPAELRDRFTRVLKGHIAIATLLFPQGIGGAHIDAFSRRALWAAGLDFDHGTGHGVGSYLSVHEGPVSLSRLAKPAPLAPGMLLSNEPGFYVAGRYGIRLENLVLVQPAVRPDAIKPFLCFETVSLAPFERRLIEPELLDGAELRWLDDYHQRVLDEIGPLVDGQVRAWLAGACAPFGGA
jgi:Xaa-Pro aminopeptidase